MTTQLIFSIVTIKACNGNAMADAAYLEFFLRECVVRLEAAAKAVADMVDGQVSFTENTLAIARAKLGVVRFHTDALLQCQKWFASKPDIKIQFTAALNSTSSKAIEAQTNFDKLFTWL